jgi:lipoate-protein ligase A
LLAASELTPELPGLQELTGKSWNLAFLRDSWTRELAARLGLKLVAAGLSAVELDRARTLAVEKYDAARWNRRR